MANKCLTRRGLIDLFTNYFRFSLSRVQLVCSLPCKHLKIYFVTFFFLPFVLYFIYKYVCGMWFYLSSYTLTGVWRGLWYNSFLLLGDLFSCARNWVCKLFCILKLISRWLLLDYQSSVIDTRVLILANKRYKYADNYTFLMF